MQSSIKNRELESDQRERRRHRFTDDSTTTKPSKSDTTSKATTSVCIGTCERLEKNYFRLTSAPNPSTIRPLRILEQAFDFVMNKYQSTHDWLYISNQLKSIRQDLMVQSIRNDFTILVYEENARLALAMNDREQFIQCQTQLELLYETGGSRTHFHEFLMYRLLYSLLLNDTKKSSRILVEINELQQSTDLEHLQIAVQLCSAFRRKNFVQFFTLYQALPELAQCLVNLFLDVYRKQTISILVWGFTPTLPLDACTKILAYQSNELCHDYLHSLGLVMIDDSTNIDCKASRSRFDQH